MKSKLNLECLSERITPSAGVDNPGVTESTLISAPGPAKKHVPSGSEIAEIVAIGKELVTELNDLSDKAVILLADLIKNERAQDAAELRSKDLTLTPGERLFAAFQLNALKIKHAELVETLIDTVNEYNQTKSSLSGYNTLYNYYNHYGIDFGEFKRLPSGYTYYMPMIDPNDPLLV